jgi:hypothetical protein
MRDDPVVEVLLHGTGDEVRSLRCPDCGGSLTVSCCPEGKATVSGICLKCFWHVHFLGVESVPPWVTELGSSLTT